MYYYIKSTLWPLLALLIPIFILSNNDNESGAVLAIGDFQDNARMSAFTQIKSEVIKEGQPKYILEEYIDWEAKTHLLSKTSHDDAFSILIYENTSSIFKYKPYTCKKLKSQDLIDNLPYSSSDGDLWPWIGVSSLMMKEHNVTQKEPLVHTLIDDMHWISYNISYSDHIVSTISIEFKDLKKNKLKLPLAMGCAELLEAHEIKSIFKDDGMLENINRNSTKSLKYEMEISATDYKKEGLRAKTEIFDLVLARASLGDQKTKSLEVPIDVYLMHIKGFQDKTGRETKLGSAAASMILPFQDPLEINESVIESLLEDTDDYKLIGKIQNGKWETLHYENFRKPKYDIFPGAITIIKTYDRVNGRVTLRAVKVMRYNDDRTELEMVYRIRLLRQVTGFDFYGRAKLFDLSSCLRSNYFDVYYEIQSNNIPHLAELFYEQFSNRDGLQLNFLRVPEIQQWHDEIGVRVRATVLDTKPDPIVQFNLVQGKSFRDRDGGSQGNENEELHFAGNVEHCSDLCKMYFCDMFSYCLNKECKVTSTNSTVDGVTKSNPNEELQARFIDDSSCTLYIKAPEDFLNKTPIRSSNDILSELNNVEGALMLSLSIPSFRPQYKTVGTSKLVPARFYTDLYSYSDESDEIEPSFHGSIRKRRFKENFKGFDKEQDDPARDKRIMLTDQQHYDECALSCRDKGVECGSFSYCHSEKKCIISDYYEIPQILSNSIEDSDCIIARRDFLTKFALSGERVEKPVLHDNFGKEEAYDEHDCAHQCMYYKIKPNSKCLSFYYCPADTTSNRSNNECIMLATKDLKQMQLDSTSKAILKLPFINRRPRKTNDGKLTCSHYQRSYLADFNRIDHKSLKKDLKIDESPSGFLPEPGKNADMCASLCRHDRDCDMFQHCYFPNEAQHHLCLIAAGGSRVSFKRSDLLFMLFHSKNCHFYTMKKDTTTGAAYITSEQLNDEVIKQDDENDGKQDTKQQMVQVENNTLVLTIIAFILSPLVGMGIAIFQHFREPIEQKCRRLFFK